MKRFKKVTIFSSIFISGLLLGVLGMYMAKAGPGEDKVMDYQGVLLDKDGNPISVPTTMIFSIYIQAEGGLPLWSETQEVFPSETGVFSVQLGQSSPLPPNFFKDNPILFLGIAVEGDPEMAPRQQLATVAYAYQAENANMLGGKKPEDFAPKDHQHPSYEIPSGMIVMFDRSCPSGWTRVSALDNRFPMGGTSYGATGGTSSHSHSVPNHTHTVSGETSGASRGDTSAGGQWFTSDRGDPEWQHRHTFSATTSSAGGGSTNDVSHIPPYVTVVFCRKD